MERPKGLEPVDEHTVHMADLALAKKPKGRCRFMDGSTGRPTLKPKDRHIGGSCFCWDSQRLSSRRQSDTF